MDTNNKINFQPKGLIHSGVWNVSALIVLAVIGFVTLPIVVGEIGPQDYGIYVLLLMIGGFVGLLDFGLGEATLKFLSQYYASNDLKGINRVIGSTLTINAIAGILGCSVIIFYSSWIISIFRIDPEKTELVAKLLKCAGIGFCLALFAGAFSAIPQALQRYDILNKVRIILSILRALAMIVVVKLGYGITGLVILMPVNTVLNIIVFLVIAFRLIPGIRPWPRPSRNGLKEVFGYGFFAFVNQLIGKLSQESGKIVLGIFFGTAEISYLDVPKRLLTRGAGVYGAAGRALFPRFSSMKEDERMRELFLNSTWCLLCLSLVLFVPTTIVMSEFLRLWMGEEFASQSAKVAMIIAASMALKGAFVPYFGLLKGTGRVHWLTIAFLVTTGIGTCAGILLVMKFGLLGAGYRAWVVVWCGFVIVLFVCRKVFPGTSLRSVLIMVLVGPIVESLLCGIAFWWLWARIDLHGWIPMIFAWIIMGTILSFFLWGSNRVLTGPQGAAGIIYLPVRTFLRRIFVRSAQTA